MIKLSIVGTITSEFNDLVKILQFGLPSDVILNEKIRTFGEEINASSEYLILYLYRINQNNFQLEAEVFSIRKGLVFLDQITIELQKLNISYVFDYFLSDSQGNFLTREKSRRFQKNEI